MKQSFILTCLILAFAFSCNQGIGGSLAMAFDVRQKFDFVRVHPTIGVRANYLNLELTSQNNKDRSTDELKSLAGEIDQYISEKYINATKNHTRSYTFQDTNEVVIATLHFDKNGGYLKTETPK